MLHNGNMDVGHYMSIVQRKDSVSLKLIRSTYSTTKTFRRFRKIRSVKLIKLIYYSIKDLEIINHFLDKGISCFFWLNDPNVAGG